MSDAEVIVVGGGPAGAATASRLAAAGVDVLVLDRARFPREKACAEFLSPGTVDALSRLGVLDAASVGGAWQRGIRIVSAGAEFTLVYDGDRRGLGIARPVLDTLLLQQSVACGARVREGVTALAAVREHGRVTGVRVRDAAGAKAVLTAELVVVADGLRSRVARSLGLDRPAPWPRRLGFVAHVRHAAPSQFGLMAVGDGRYCGVATVGGGETSVGLAVESGWRGSDESASALFTRTIGSLPAARDALAGAIRATSIRGAAPLARAVRGVSVPGCLLVGDAAGFTDPFTGEGVHRALRGAELAADAAVEALGRHDRHPVRYTAARDREFASKQRACLLLQAVLAAPPLFEYCLRRAAKRRRPAGVLAGVFGDYVPAGAMFRPAVLADLVRP